MKVNRDGGSRVTRRRLFGALGTLAMAPAVTAASGPPASRRRKPTLKTRTFSSFDPITLPSSGPSNAWPAKIKASGFKRGKVTRVTLTLTSVSHSSPTDIDIVLQAPNGRKAKVWSDAGGSTPLSTRTITLDDDATQDLPASGIGAADHYRPMNYGGADASFAATGGPGDTTNVSLATFKGVNPNGTWKLWVTDDAAGDAGTINGGWSLTISAKVKH